MPDFFRLLSIWCIFSVGFCFYDENDCKWRENVTDVEDLMKHKYAVLEQCLYYYISQKANEKAKQYNARDAIVEIPPIDGPKDTLDITIQEAFVHRVWMNEYWKEMNIEGNLVLGWKDKRITWSTGEWKVQNLKIESSYHIWVPDLETSRSLKSHSGTFFSTYKDIKATPTGDISTKFYFTTSTMCSVDFYNFPNDVSHCCFELKSTLFPEMLKFVSNAKGKLDEDLFQSTWHISNVETSVVDSDGDKNVQAFKVCLKLGRLSKTLRMEMTLPIVISAILVIVSPIFGSFKHQHMVKLFTLGLQFFCFQYLVARTPQLGFGGVIPKIYTFYEFSISITMISLLVTLLFDALTRIERKLPPPHNLFLTAAAINARLCCAEEPETHPSATSANTSQHHDSAPSTKTDWAEVFAALNNVMSILITVVYILGILILCT